MLFRWKDKSPLSFPNDFENGCRLPRYVVSFAAERKNQIIYYGERKFLKLFMICIRYMLGLDISLFPSSCFSLSQTFPSLKIRAYTSIFPSLNVIDDVTVHRSKTLDANIFQVVARPNKIADLATILWHKLNFYLTQALTGHEVFEIYVFKLKRRISVIC